MFTLSPINVKNRLHGVGALCLLLPLATSLIGLALRPSVPHKRTPVAAFYVAWDPASFSSLATNIGRIDRLYPEWLLVTDAQGRIEVCRDHRAAHLLRRHRHVAVLPLVTNSNPRGGWLTKEIGAVLTNPHLRSQLVSTLTHFASNPAYAGLMIDLEAMPLESRDGYMVFIRDLAMRLHHQGKQIDVAVPLDNWEQLDDAALSQAVDHLCLMAYDEHSDSSGAGPIASHGWLKRHLADRAEEIPAQKMILGLGNYGYDWAQNESRATDVSYPDAVALAAQGQTAITFHAQSLNPTFSYQDPQQRMHRVWYLDAPTLHNQMKVGLYYRPFAIALWRLGSEDPGVWDVFDETARGSDRPSLSQLSFGYGAVRHIAGQRALQWDATSNLVMDESIERYPHRLTRLSIKRFFRAFLSWKTIGSQLHRWRDPNALPPLIHAHSFTSAHRTGLQVRGTHPPTWKVLGLHWNDAEILASAAGELTLVSDEISL